MIVDKIHLKSLHMLIKFSLSSVESFSNLYIIFTSDSTEMSKKALITHSNFSSVIKHQQSVLEFKNTSQVFDFMLYIFDVV